MANVYIVTDGAYSDYHICAVFSTKEKAEEYAKILGADVEEKELDPTFVTPPARMQAYNIELYYNSGRNGEIVRAYQATMESYMDYKQGSGTGQFPPDGEPLPANVDHWPCNAITGILVLANDEQHALKIASEKRALLLGTGRWPLIYRKDIPTAWHYHYLPLQNVVP